MQRVKGMDADPWKVTSKKSIQDSGWWRKRGEQFRWDSKHFDIATIVPNEEDGAPATTMSNFKANSRSQATDREMPPAMNTNGPPSQTAEGELPPAINLTASLPKLIPFVVKSPWHTKTKRNVGGGLPQRAGPPPPQWQDSFNLLAWMEIDGWRN